MRQACITYHLRHAFGTSDITKGFGNESSIAICVLKASLKICSHFLGGTKVLSYIVPGSDSFVHNTHLGFGDGVMSDP